MPALKHWIYADDGIPAWQTAIAKSAFVAGRLRGDTETGQTAVFSAVTGTDFIRCNRPVSRKHGFHALG